MKTPEPPVWLSTAEAAEHLGLTPRTLYRLIDQGEIAAYRVGRLIRVTLDDVHAFMERSRIKPGELRHLYPGEEDDDEL